MPMLMADEDETKPTTELSPSSGSLLDGGTADSEELMTGIVGAVLMLFRYIGIILLVWSIGQLVLAFKDGDGNSKTQAAMMIVVSILLIGLKTFLDMANVI